MATKKTTTASAQKPAKAASKTSGTAMTKWDEELAARAKAGSATAGSAAGTSKSINTKSGIFTIDGQSAGQTLRCIILEGVLENAYYGPDGDYDPDNPRSPVSFAIGQPGQKADELVWHEDSLPEHAGTLCKDTDINQWGSAEKGRGKATKNVARLMVIAADDLDDIAGAEARRLKVPVTSVKNWAAYVKQLSALKGWPTLAVVTEITLTPHPKWQFEMNFRHVEDVDGDLIGDLLAKEEATRDDLTRPYSKQSEEEEEAQPARAGKATAKPSGKGAGAAKGRGR